MFSAEIHLIVRKAKQLKRVRIILQLNMYEFLQYNYKRINDEVVRCLYLRLYYEKDMPKLHIHSFQEIIEIEKVEIRVDIRIQTEQKVKIIGYLQLFLIKEAGDNTFEVIITSHDILQLV
ncbi:hypothetical protein NUSPORA_02409 [Nucleospora cyclopteri]